MKGEISQLIKTASNEESQSESQSETQDSDDSATVFESDPNSAQSELEITQAEEGETQLAPINTGGGRPARRASGVSLRRASTASFAGPRGKLTDEEGTAGLKSKQNKEFSEQGKVKWSVYSEYAKTSNLVAVAIYLITLVGAQTAQIGKFAPGGVKKAYLTISTGGSVWLKNWSEINGRYGGNPHVGKYIGIYFAFGIGSAA
ncbi:ATP-binding cassette glutathione S-conjugate transporter, partial [Aureobasidium melanogenum]